MRNNALYSVLYTIVLCAVCAGMLTFTHVRWKKLIEANEDYARIFAMVDAVGLVKRDALRDEVIRLYDSSFALKPKGQMRVFEAHREGKLLGYAVDVLTRGKYGPIKGVLVISADKQTIGGLRIYDQNETPGLGGRISSREWLAKFAGKPLVTAGVPGIIISNKVKGANVVDAITGASKTTFNLGKAVNTLISRFLAGGMALEPLDLGLGPDAVTRATPGYPKNLVKPANLREEVRRPDFMVPPGLKNLALGRPVSCSMEDEPIIGEFSQIVDGVKKSGEFDFVELDPEPQWVQIDLGEPRRVYCIVVWHYYKNPVIYNDVIVQAASEPDFAQDVHTLFNNDVDNSSELGEGTGTAYFARWWGELVDARGPGKEGTLMRYVRVYTNGGCGGEDTRFVEIQAFGK